MCKKCENGKNTKDEGRETCCDREIKQEKIVLKTLEIRASFYS